MKTLYQIFEAIRPVSKGEGLVVFDIDDTLCKANKDIVKIYKHPNGDTSKEVALTTDEFAVDPDVKDHIDWFDIRDFRDPVKVYQSILKGTPLVKNLRILDAHINAGYDFCFLTARGCEDVIKQAIEDFLMVKDTNGQLRKIGNEFKKTLSHAVNDDAKKYPGDSDADKKGRVLRDLCSKYKKVVFVDDDPKNVKNAKALNINNLTVLTAWK